MTGSIKVGTVVVVMDGAFRGARGIVKGSNALLVTLARTDYEPALIKVPRECVARDSYQSLTLVERIMADASEFVG